MYCIIDKNIQSFYINRVTMNGCQCDALNVNFKITEDNKIVITGIKQDSVVGETRQELIDATEKANIMYQQYYEKYKDKIKKDLEKLVA